MSAWSRLANLLRRTPSQPLDLPEWIHESQPVTQAFDGVSGAAVRRDAIVEISSPGHAKWVVVRLRDRRWVRIDHHEPEGRPVVHHVVVGASFQRVFALGLDAEPVQLAGDPDWITTWFPQIPDHVLDGVSGMPVCGAHVVEVACQFTETRGSSSYHEVAIVRLRDGRWAALWANCGGITDDPIATVVVAASRKRVWWFGIGDDDRELLTRTLSRDALEEELVEIDELLESEDPEERALGERRMLRRAGKRQREEEGEGEPEGEIEDEAEAEARKGHG